MNKEQLKKIYDDFYYYNHRFNELYTIVYENNITSKSEDRAMIEEMKDIMSRAYYRAQITEIKEIFQEIGNINDLKSRSQFEYITNSFLYNLKIKIESNL